MKNSIQKIETKQAPEALGPYSQAVRVHITDSELIFVSGQLPIDPATGTLIDGDIEKATSQVLDNIEAILASAKSSLNDVVRVEIFLKDLNDFKKMNEEYSRRFTSPTHPARQTIQVAKLPLDASIEISCIAVALKQP